MGFKMDLIGILAHVTSVLVMFCPLQMANGITDSKTPFYFFPPPLHTRRAEHHPNTGHTTNIRVRLQQESIATGYMEFKLHFCIWFPLSVQTIKHSQKTDQ